MESLIVFTMTVYARMLNNGRTKEADNTRINRVKFERIETIFRLIVLNETVLLFR